MARILIIEDDPIYRELIVEALTAEGYETVSAENGDEGLQRALAYLPDLVISDVVMEKLDGYQVLAALRAEPATAGIPFIMITGWSSKGGHRQGMSMGADDYLAKPFNAGELLASVAARLRKRERSSDRESARSARIGLSISSLLPAEAGRSLRTISGFADIMIRDCARLERGEIEEMARHIQVAAADVRRLVDHFAVYNQLQLLEEDEAGAARLREARSDGLGSVIDGRARGVARRHDREADLTLRLADGSAAIGEPYLSMLVDELIDNAFKFSPHGSPVEVVTAFTSGRFGFAVTDKGRGMSPEELASVDAFAQFGRTEYAQSGIGLGLAVSRSLARLHGGVLSIRSREGDGTRVSVEIPRPAPFRLK